MSVRYLRGLVEYVVSTGTPMDRALEELQFTAGQLRDPDAHIKHEHQDVAFAAAERLTGDPAVGLHAGERVRLVHFGFLGHMALASRSFGELLDVQAYQELIGNGVRSTVSRGPATTTIEYTPVRTGLSRHALEYTLAAQVSLARLLVGDDFALSGVDLMHDEPLYAREHRRIFACPVYFSAARNRVVFPRCIERLALTAADPLLLESLRLLAARRLEALQARVHAEHSEVARCRLFIAERLSNGAPSIEDTSKMLGVTVRTLQRRLEEQQLSYRDLVDSTRQEMADQLLKDTSLALSDVALLLGFSEHSAFTRAFRRWFKMSPREARERLKAAAD